MVRGRGDTTNITFNLCEHIWVEKFLNRLDLLMICLLQEKSNQKHLYYL